MERDGNTGRFKAHGAIAGLPSPSASIFYGAAGHYSLPISVGSFSKFYGRSTLEDYSREIYGLYNGILFIQDYAIDTSFRQSKASLASHLPRCKVRIDSVI